MTPKSLGKKNIAGITINSSMNSNPTPLKKNACVYAEEKIETEMNLFCCKTARSHFQ